MIKVTFKHKADHYSVIDDKGKGKIKVSCDVAASNQTVKENLEKELPIQKEINLNKSCEKDTLENIINQFKKLKLNSFISTDIHVHFEIIDTPHLFTIQVYILKKHKEHLDKIVAEL